MAEYLSYHEVVTIHDNIIGTQGGSAGIKDAGALASCVEQPQQNIFGQELYPTLAQKAAALGYFIAKNHPFWDGNKRTAFVSMDAFLRLNGYKLQVSSEAGAEAMTLVADNVLDRDSFILWVQQHLFPLT